MYVHLKPLGCHWQCVMLEWDVLWVQFGKGVGQFLHHGSLQRQHHRVLWCLWRSWACWQQLGTSRLRTWSHFVWFAADCPLPVLLLSFANGPTLPSQLPIVGGWPYNRKRKNKPTETDLSCNASLKWCATLHSGTVWLLSLEQQKNSMMHSILNDLLLRSFKLDAQLHVWRCYHSSGKI